MSGLPFAMPAWMHYQGRNVRYGLDRASARLGWLPPAIRLAISSDGNQWGEWIRQPGGGVDSALRFVMSSTVLDHAAIPSTLALVRQGKLPLSGSRLMQTTSFAAHFR